MGSCATNVDEAGMETDDVDEYKAMLTVDSVDESSLRRPDPEEVDATEHLQVVLVVLL